MVDPLSKLRHAIRGSLNALKLSVSAVGLPMPTSQKLEFLDDVAVSADHLIELLDQLIALPLPGESDHPADHELAGAAGDVR